LPQATVWLTRRWSFVTAASCAMAVLAGSFPVSEERDVTGVTQQQQATLLTMRLVEGKCDGPAEDTLPGSPVSLRGFMCASASDASTAASVCSSSDGGENSPAEAKGQRRVRFSLSSNEIFEISPRALGSSKRREINDEEVTAMFAMARKSAARREMLEKFLMSEGFLSLDVNSRRRKWFKTTLPLHVACKRGDEKLVELLLTSGADATLLDSKRRAPADVAKKYNFNGSHDAVLRVLGQH